MGDEKIEVVGVFIPARDSAEEEDFILLDDDVLPLRDGQTVKLFVGDRTTHSPI